MGERHRCCGVGSGPGDDACARSIRLAQRRLTKDEMLQIKHHPIYSLDIIENTPSIGTMVRTIVYQAHERCDGSGYPRGRAGIAIHPMAKLLAVADSYSAMTTDKPQRKAMSSIRRGQRNPCRGAQEPTRPRHGPKLS